MSSIFHCPFPRQAGFLSTSCEGPVQALSTPPGGPAEAGGSALSLLSDFLLAMVGSLEEPRKSFLEGCCYSLPRMAISTRAARLTPLAKRQTLTCSHLPTEPSKHLRVPTKHMRQASTREAQYPAQGHPAREADSRPGGPPHSPYWV